ncbi:MAG: DUF4846 domain-containing protein [Treponema sp.]|nr:DUF4846 domain-containing protein [Treponema sp.]
MKKLPFSVTFFLLFAIALLPIFSDLFHPLQLVKNEGNTLTERIDTPFKFKRIEVEKGSFADYIRSYPLKPADAPVLLYDGRKKANQNAHCAVFSLPLENRDLQQCADSIMRLYAEYLYKTNQEEKIKFHYSNGFISEWSKWKKGFRISVAGNLAKWTKYEKTIDKKTSFQDYLRNVFAYCGTSSMESYESKPTVFSKVEIGDVLLYGGNPGHVCLVVDVCKNTESGEKAVLLAQGFMPAQDFHILKNPKRINNPWYYEEDFIIQIQTPEYTFPKDSWRKLNYLD